MATDSKGREANPLDKYRSYSYHHILLVSDSTEALREIQESQVGGTFNTSAFENAVMNKPLPGTTRNGSGGVFVVIDGRKTSTISIKSVSFTTSATGGSSVSSANSLVSTVDIEVYDVYGVTLLNYLQYLSDEALQCSYSGLIWTLQTLFIGHTDEGTTETILTNNLPLTGNTIDVEFDATGGHYKMTFVTADGGSPAMNTAGRIIGQSSTSLKSDNNRTLWSVIQDFQDHLNKESKDYYDKLRVTMLPSIAANGQNSQVDIPQVGRLVQYMFTIPDSWKTFIVDGGAAAHTETNWKDKKNTDTTGNKQLAAQDIKQTPNTSKGAVNVNLHAELTVDAALTEILKHCDQVLIQAGNNNRVKGNEAKLWKILSNITSDSKTACLHWDILEFDLPNISSSKSSDSAKEVPAEAKNWDQTTDSAGNQTYIPKNCLIFDYMFSGKNKDITHLEMKLPMAQSILTNTNPRFDTASKVLQNQKNNAQATETGKKNELGFIQKNTPIFLPSKTTDQLSAYSHIAPGSSQSAQVRQEFYKTLAEYSATNSSGVSPKMTIRGNPLLMAHTSLKIAPHVTGPLTAQSSDDGNYKQYLKGIVDGANSDSSTILPKSIATYPLFIKLNIFTPDLDFDGVPNSDANGNTNYARQFWYDKYYNVSRITHTFSADGDFHQDIEMQTYGIYQAPAEKDAKK